LLQPIGYIINLKLGKFLEDNNYVIFQGSNAIRDNKILIINIYYLRHLDKELYNKIDMIILNNVIFLIEYMINSRKKINIYLNV